MSPARPQSSSRFTFWIDRTGTLGPVLLRYDVRGRGPTRGARLGVDGRWHASAVPDQLMWLGTGSAERVDLDQAGAMAAALGATEADLLDPRVQP